ncbi:MAG: 3-hydroxybutyryl-CoA dehydrogenase [Chloroflexi bacterium]|nr:3-hydroxybutyryl-CoA dehydrogenase [Chloroflexota bacterium]
MAGKRIGVVGAGTMGAGIAQVAATAGFHVLLYDLETSFLERGLAVIGASLERFGRRGRLSEEEISAALDRIEPVTDLRLLSDVDAVIEAATEDLPLKRELFQRLDAICPGGTLLATNTSSLSVTAIASAVSSPQRVIGMHFFNPPVMLDLVEVARAAQSSHETVSLATELARELGKQPVEVADTPGFLVNRASRPFYLEALRILGEGLADVPTIDRIMRQVGFKMGPFELIDLIGLDVNYTVSLSIFEQTFHDPRFRPPALQRQLVRAGRLGRKSGRGFYEYDSPGPVLEDAATSSAGVAGLDSAGARSGPVAVLGTGPEADDLRQRCAARGIPISNGASEASLVVAVETGHLEARRLGLQCALEQATGSAPVLVYSAPWSVTEIASTLPNTGQVVGFSMVGSLAEAGVVEVAGGLNTEPSAVGRAARLLARLGKETAIVGDGPGMVSLRIVAMLANEAAAALHESLARSPADVDLAMRLGVAYPRGPLAWADEIGVDHVLQTVRVLQQDYGADCYRPAIPLRRYAQAGRTGRRAGRGFFDYDGEWSARGIEDL